MAWLDSFKRLFKGSTGLAAKVDEPDLPEPRIHHYEFAHRALPQIAFTNPDRLVADLERDASQALDSIWRFVAKKLTDAGATPMTEHGISAVTKVDLGSTPGWVVTLARPRASPEAAMVAFVPGNRSGVGLRPRSPCATSCA